MNKIVVVALYKFVTLADYKLLRNPLLETMRRLGVKGSLLLATEGINGTLAGSREGVDEFLDNLRGDLRFADINCKESFADEMPFYRAKVKLKKEIVSMGVANIDPAKNAGTYVTPDKWNELLADPEVLLIDTRNDYEVEIGAFAGAVNLHTATFRQFPDYVAANLDKNKHKKIAMYCTGGIRCEKSTAFLRQAGFDEVYHLQGGILQYLQEVPVQKSLWQGECFVFDNRVAVNHNLAKGSYDQCYACRHPVNEDNKKSPHYKAGISCHRCFDKSNPSQKRSFAQRHKQMGIAKSRGETHIGCK